jgi:hypothetical protein
MTQAMIEILSSWLLPLSVLTWGIGVVNLILGIRMIDEAESRHCSDAGEKIRLARGRFLRALACVLPVVGVIPTVIYLYRGSIGVQATITSIHVCARCGSQMKVGPLR